ncbi:MAG: hypothetical protein ACKOWF_19010 [Chloroflexota bacterium]
MVDQLLGGLFGGPDGDRMRSQAKDFVSRYDQGPPDQGYEPTEVLDRFKQVGRAMDPTDLQDAAQQSFKQMPPEMRRAYKQAMKQRGVPQFQQLPDDKDDDPSILAEMTRQAMEQQAKQQAEAQAESKGKGFDGSVGALLGQEGDKSLLDNPAVKAAFAGMAAFAMKKILDQKG